jgi:hypothetical protein
VVEEGVSNGRGHVVRMVGDGAIRVRIDGINEHHANYTHVTRHIREHPEYQRAPLGPLGHQFIH